MKIDRSFAALTVLPLLLFAWPRAAAPAPAPALAGGATPISTLPWIIAIPGSYCVTENLSSADSVGISIEVDDVVLDLGGFQLNGGGAGGTGIRSTGRRVLVRNGSIADWTSRGIDLGDGSAVEDVSVSGSDAIGITIGSLGRVSRCIIEDNAERALTTGPSCIVSDCTIRGVGEIQDVVRLGSSSIATRVVVQGGGTGIVAGTAARVESCTASNFGVAGFLLSRSASGIGCSADPDSHAGESNLVGFELDVSSRIEACQAAAGLSRGVRTFASASVERTSVDGAEIGISAGFHSRIADCVVRVSSDTGVQTGSSARVTNSQVHISENAGIRVGDGTRVEGCQVASGNGDGIVLSNHCVASNNSALENDGTGLLVLGDANRIAGNTLDQNLNGLVVQGTHNLVDGNRAANNTAQDATVPFGNASGPFLNSSWWIQGSFPQANFRTPFP